MKNFIRHMVNNHLIATILISSFSLTFMAISTQSFTFFAVGFVFLVLFASYVGWKNNPYRIKAEPNDTSKE